MTTKNELENWKDAKTFDDLCTLMKRSLKGDGSFNSFPYDETNCVLAEECMTYQNDFIKLNQLGFLTIGSQPGTIQIERVNDNISHAGDTKDIKEYVRKKQIKPNDLIRIYEQREYIEGFMTKDTLLKILPKLNNYIIYVQPVDGKNSEVKIRNNYHDKLEQNVIYIYMPEHYKEVWPKSSCLLQRGGKQLDYMTNLSRFAYDFKKDVISKYQKNRKLTGHKDGDETDKEKLLDGCFNLILEDCTFTNNFINYNVHLMDQPCKKHLDDAYDFDIQYHFHSFNKQIITWMEQNTYLITIIRPEYGTNGLTDLLISLLSDNKNELKDWSDANSFDDLCTLMQQFLKGNFESFTPELYEEVNCLLDKKNIECLDDFIKLNQLKFLTIRSEPGTIEICQDNYDEIDDIHKKYIKESGNDGEKFIRIYERRAYIEGFMTKETLLDVLPELHERNYIVCLQPSYCKNSKVEIKRTCNYELERNVTYIYIPQDFNESKPEASCVVPTCNSLKDGDYCEINLRRNTYDLRKDVIYKYQEKNKAHEEDTKDVIDTLNDNCMIKDLFFFDECINYNKNLMNLFDRLELTPNHNFDKTFRHFEKHLTQWMAENTYLVTIIDPEYGPSEYSLPDILKEILSDD